MIGVHYGDRLSCSATGLLYYVRAVAPGVCVVIAETIFPLEEPAPENALKVLHPPMFAKFQVVA